MKILNTFVAGDTGSKLQVTCLNNDTELAYDLTGTTVTLQWLSSVGVLQTRTMTIDNAVGGVASYVFAANELYSPSMRFEVKLTDLVGSVIRSLQTIDVVVRSPIG